jgi:acetyl/propionyl-CoA carboxylase alpha subunit
VKKPVLIDGRRHELVLSVRAAAFELHDSERVIAGDRRWSTGGRLLLTVAGRACEATVVRARDGRYEVWIDSERHVAEEERRGAAGGAEAEDDALTAPMPAKVVKIAVAAGDDVADGQTLVVLESMKMELGVTSPRAGRVKRVGADVKVGAIVPAGTMLIELEPVPAV